MLDRRSGNKYADPFTHDKRTCQCVRCRGFQPGNKLSPGAKPKHGAWVQPLRMGKDVDEKTALIREHMPHWNPAFEATLQSYAVTLVRIERAQRYLEEQDKLADELEEYEAGEKNKGLRDDLAKWLSASLKFANALGLTPLAAATILRETNPGGGSWRPISSNDLEGVSLEKLKELRQVLAALKEDEPIDVEAA